MNANLLRWLFAGSPLLLLLTISPLAAQRPVGLPEDWSHHRLIFSSPGDAQQAQQYSTLQKWATVISDFRYLHQVTRRNRKPAPPTATLVPAEPAVEDTDEKSSSSANQPGVRDITVVTASSTGFAGNSIQLQSTLAGFTWASSKLRGTDVGLCGASAPNVYWSYNATTSGPDLARDLAGRHKNRICGDWDERRGAARIALEILRFKICDPGRVRIGDFAFRGVM